MKYDDILKNMAEVRRPFWNHWRDVAKYLYPAPIDWLQTKGELQARPETQHIINGAGTKALDSFTAGMTEGIISRTRPWFMLGVPGKRYDPYGPPGRWLTGVRDLMLETIAGTNFYHSMGKVIRELGGFGSAAAVIMPDRENVFRVTQFEIGSFYFGLDGMGRVRQLGRHFLLTTDQVKDKFGPAPEGAESLRRMMASDNAQDKTHRHSIGHLILPQQGRFPFVSIYFLSEIGTQAKTSQNIILEKTNLREWPAVTPRWGVFGDAPYGSIYPGALALPEIKQLQQLERREGQGLDRITNPTILLDASLRNQPIATTPGSKIYVRNLRETEGARNLYHGLRVPFGELGSKRQELENRIQTIFLNDLFMMISRLDTVRSATEIDARREEKLTMIGPSLEQFENEALDPAITRIYNIMDRAGLFPPPPPELEGAPLQPRYRSMLAEAQQAVQTASIERIAAFAGNLLAAEPTLLDTVDLENGLRKYADLLNAPPEMIRSVELAEERKARRNQSRTEQAGLDQATQLTEGARNLSATEVGGGQNALEYIINGLG